MEVLEPRQLMTALDVAQALADVAFADQQNVINNTLATDLAAFSGDTTNVGLNAFEWPTLPTPFVLPDAVEDLSAAPSVSFSGPVFDWLNDPVYQSLTATADDVYRLAREAQFASVASAYASQQQTVGTLISNRRLLFDAQVSTAVANYEAALSAPNPFANVLATALLTRDSQTLLAELNFQDDLRNANDDYNLDVSLVNETSMDDMTDASDNRQVALQNAVTDQDVAAAERDYTKEMADAAKLAAEGLAQAVKDQRVAIANANFTHSSAVVNAVSTLQTGRSNYDLFELNRVRLAEETLHVVWATITRDHDKDQAAINHNFHAWMVTTNAARDVVLNDLLIDRQVATVSARAAAFAAWAAATATPWAIYQASAMAAEEASTLILQPISKGIAQTEINAGATKDLATLVAKLDRVHAHREAFAQQALANAVNLSTDRQQAVAAQHAAQQASIGPHVSSFLASVGATQAYIQQDAENVRAREVGIAEAQRVYSHSLADAEYQRQVDLSNDIDPEPLYSSTVASATSILRGSRHSPVVAYETANFTAAQTRGQDKINARTGLQDTLLTVSDLVSHTGTLGAHQAAELDIGTTINAAFETAQATAEANYIGTLASAMATYAGAMESTKAMTIQATAAQAAQVAVAKAGAKLLFDQTVVSDFTTAINNWAAGVGTPAAFQLAAVRIAEANRVRDYDSAVVSRVSGVSVADVDWATAASNAEATFIGKTATALATSVSAIATASAAQVGPTLTAQNAKATGILNAKNAYNTALTNASQTLVGNEITARNTLWRQSHLADVQMFFNVAVDTDAWLNQLMTSQFLASQVTSYQQTNVSTLIGLHTAYAGTMVSERTAWTTDAGIALNALTQTIGNALVNFATATTLTQMTALTNSSNAEGTRITTVSAEEIARATTVAIADLARSTAIANADESYAQDVANADEAFAVAIATATTNYDTALANQRLAALTAWASGVSTPFATYSVDVMTANRNFVVSEAAERLIEETAEAAAEKGLTNGEAAAQRQSDVSAAAARTTYVIADVTNRQTTLSQSEAFQRAFHLSNAASAAASQLLLVQAQRSYNNTVFSAAVTFEGLVAGIGATWVATVAPLKGQLLQGSLTQAQFEDLLYATGGPVAQRTAAMTPVQNALFATKRSERIAWVTVVATVDESMANGEAGTSLGLVTTLGGLAVSSSFTERGDRNAYVQGLTSAALQYATDAATARTIATAARGTARVAYATALAPDLIAQATALATAEGTYLVSLANQAHADAVAWTGSANSSLSLAAGVTRDWLTLVAGDFTTYQTSVATAETNRATAMTAASAAQANQEASADLSYATAAATASKNRTDATVAASETFRHQKVQHQSQHATDYSLATFNKISSVMAATKTNSINIATGNDPAAENTILDGLITTANNAAESGYNTADKTFRLAEVGTQSTRANSVATAQKNHAVAMALADEGLTNGYAGAELTYDLQQASQDYTYAVAIAGATGTAQAAQYADRATALATLQALVSKPWTAFMRDVATAEATWAAGQAGNYVTYQTALATAQQTYDINTANAVHTETTTESAVERQWLVDVANHARTAALGSSAADLAYATAVINSSLTLATAQGNWLTDNANVTFTQTTTDALSQSTHQTGLANAVFAYSQTEAGEAQTQTQSVATATAAFEVATAAVYAAAMSAFSLVQPSPWATQQALFAQARLVWVTAVAPVYVTQQFADAATEYSQNMATANQKLSDASTAATTAFNGTTTAANDALSAALAQAADVASGTEASGLSLPLLPALPDNERLGDLSPQRHGEDDGPDYTTVFSFFPKRLQNQGSQGDLGYYLRLVSEIQLNHIDTHSDDGYSDDYNRLLGEWIIRPLVGDAILSTASDKELLIGTAAFVVFGAGLALCPGPALVGAFMSAGQSAVGQYVTTGTVDFHQVFVAGIIGGACGVGGAVGGLVIGRAVVGAKQLATTVFGANAANVCKTATFLVQTTVKLYQVQQTVNTAVAIANGDVNAAAGLAFSFGMGRFTKALSFCFVYETPVAVGWKPIIETAMMPPVSVENDEGSSMWWIIGGIGCVGAFVALRERRRRIELSESVDDFFADPKLFNVLDEPLPSPTRSVSEGECSRDREPSRSRNREISMVEGEMSEIAGAPSEVSRLPRLPTERPSHPRSRRRSKAASRAYALTSSLLIALGILCSWKAWPGVKSVFTPKSALASVQPNHSPPKRELLTIPIGELTLGRRVIANNPELSRAEATPLEIDPATWRAISLEMTKPDGHKLWIELLRSLEWLDESGAAVGESIDLDLAELGAEGEAEVLSIAPCPDIEPDDGNSRRIITGRFRHESAEVVDVSLSTGESIGTTASHRWWSEDRQAFVPAGELRIGEHLRSLGGGDANVTNIELRATPEAVYNLEVETEHVYFVGKYGLLVHNAYANPTYSQQSRSHVFTRGHAANSLPIPRQSRFLPTQGGQNFTNEVINHPNVIRTPQGNGRTMYSVPDLGRNVGYNRNGNLTRGGTVIVEGPNPQSWSTYQANEIVTQFPQ